MQPEALESLARDLLPPEVYDYYAGGAGSEVTVVEAARAWRSWRLRPRVLRDVAEVGTEVELMGSGLAAPVLVAPTALHGLAASQAEVATAVGAREAGSLLVLSTRASAPMADVAAAAGPWWLQVYVFADRGVTRDQVREAAALGARALVLTGDTPVVGRKRRDRSLLGAAHAPASYGELPQARNVTPADVALLAEASGLPVLVKGVLRGDDAVRCLEAGAAGVWVSNHGGRQLDGAVATAHALPEVAQAVRTVGTRAGNGPVLVVDGGIRTGRDVLVALALGADAVALGRPVLWALAAGSAEEGGGPARAVQSELGRMRDDVAHVLALAGARRPGDVGRDLVTASPLPVVGA